MPHSELYRRLFELACEEDLDGVLARTLDLVLEAAEGERGFVVTLGGGEMQVRSARNLDGDAITSPTMRPSRTVVREAYQAGRPVRITHALESEGLGEQESVQAGSLQSILAVPILDGSTVVAIVCVDSTRPAAFDARIETRVESLAQPLGIVFRKASRVRRLREQSQALAERLGAGEGPAILGESPALLAALDAVRRAATAEVPILLLGETGTGKELMAREVHRTSARRAGPFVTVNCAALPEHLVEAELFGHTAGAFTGATQARPGRFAAAEGGTLFLDEVGELGEAAQARFLRVLESGEIQRVGDDRSQRVDVRVVAATHQDLQETGFRQDLFYRLAVVTVRLPPLRRRPEDIPLLAEAFCLEQSLETGRDVEGLSDEARELLLRHPWPGNVRELRNAIRRAVIYAREPRIRGEDLPEALRQSASARPRTPELGTPTTLDELQAAKAEASLALERAFAAHLLHETRGNVAQAARIAGLSRPAFYGLLKRTELDAQRFRPTPR